MSILYLLASRFQVVSHPTTKNVKIRKIFGNILKFPRIKFGKPDSDTGSQVFSTQKPDSPGKTNSAGNPDEQYRQKLTNYANFPWTGRTGRSRVVCEGFISPPESEVFQLPPHLPTLILRPARSGASAFEIHLFDVTKSYSNSSKRWFGYYYHRNTFGMEC